MMQLAEPLILRKMSVRPNGDFAVQPVARDLSRFKNYIYTKTKVQHLRN